MVESFVYKVDFVRRKGRAAAQSFIMETCLAVCVEICYNINEYPQIRGNNGVSMVMSNPIVTIEMEQGGIIRAELYPEVAPNTVRNFISLIQKGFYDGTIFHRVIPGFMIQGGCPDGTGMGGPGWNIKGEFAANGVKNDLKHTRGVLSMARAMNPNSAGSQFFIMHEDAPHLDGQYAAFGKVVEGMDVVDEIASVQTDYNDKPMVPQVMKKVTIED